MGEGWRPGWEEVMDKCCKKEAKSGWGECLGKGKEAGAAGLQLASFPGKRRKSGVGKLAAFGVWSTRGTLAGQAAAEAECMWIPGIDG